MNKIDDLIKKLCPNGVEYKKVKEICNVTIGEFVHKNKQNNKAPYPVYNGGISNTGFYNDFNNDGDMILVSARGANAGFVNKISGKYWAGNSCYTIDLIDRKNNNWLYIFFSLKNNEKRLLGEQQRGSIPAISKKQIEEFEIAVPPLEVQDEIVHVLDDFMLLSAELSAELKAREKQYNYYKDKIFDFNKYLAVPLSEICSMERGGNFQKKHFTEEGVPAIHYGKIYTYYGLYTDKTLNFIDGEIAKKQKFANNNDIVMAVTSENVEDVCKCVVWEGKEPVAVSGHSVIIRHNQNARFLAYYFTTSHFQRQKERYCIGTKVIEMKPDNLAKILVPIPSIEEQNRIVSILDKFYSITNDISEGLPAEIELRQKQYEYYRDKLLTFKEISNG